MPRKEIFAIIAALFACFLWSGNFIIARGAHQFIEPATIAFWRWTVAALVVLPLAGGDIIRQFPLIRARWKFFVIMGIISVGFFNTAVYYAAHFTTAHHIALICATSPIWTLLLVGVFGLEKLTRGKIIGAVFALIGALIVITGGSLSALAEHGWNVGDLIVLVAAFAWAVYSVLLRFKPKEMKTFTFLSVIIIIGLISIAPFYAWELTYSTTPFDMRAISIYLYTGVCASVISWFAWNHAVHTIGAVKSGLVSYSMPVFSAGLAVFLLDEPLEAYHIIGFLCVMSGILISIRRRSEPPPTPS